MSLLHPFHQEILLQFVTIAPLIPVAYEQLVYYIDHLNLDPCCQDAKLGFVYPQALQFLEDSIYMCKLQYYFQDCIHSVHHITLFKRDSLYLFPLNLTVS